MDGRDTVNDSFRFFFCRYSLAPGSCTLSADVKNVCTFIEHYGGLLQDCLRSCVPAAFIKRIRRGIDYTHHQWFVQYEQLTFAIE